MGSLVIATEKEGQLVKNYGYEEIAISLKKQWVESRTTL
jgi:hypothetical protein